MKEKLIKVQEFLADKNHWCQGQYAKTIDDYPTNVNNEDAVKFCIDGACQRLASEDYLIIFEELNRVSAKLFGVSSIILLNDDTRWGYDSVMQVLDTVINENI